MVLVTILRTVARRMGNDQQAVGPRAAASSARRPALARCRGGPLRVRAAALRPAAHAVRHAGGHATALRHRKCYQMLAAFQFNMARSRQIIYGIFLVYSYLRVKQDEK